MLTVHDLIKIHGEVSTVCLVLWVAPDDTQAALIARSDSNAAPFLADMNEVRDLIDRRIWDVTEGELPSSPLDHEISEVERQKRDEAYEIIQFIVKGHTPAIFRKMERSKRIKLAIHRFGVSRPTITKYLRRFFQGGMVEGALIPHYSNCGAPGKTRAVTKGANKRGRPPAQGHPAGCNITDDLRRVFRLAVSATYARKRKHDLASAYEFCVRKFLSEEFEDPETKKTRRISLQAYRECGLPTRGQFIYWAKLDNDALDLAKRRSGVRVWEMTSKPKLGTATSRAMGPGSRFQIDATVLDLYIRSRGNRRTLVGRPTLYVVIDVFSRLIVGIYIGLEHPSWVAAMMALANCIEDKVSFCKRFGLQIRPEEWPVSHICGALLGDNGEMKSNGVESILRKFRVDVENHAPYRADWKGVVETRFKSIQMAFGPYVDGYIESDFRVRGGTDYREDAVLDLDDVTRIILDIVIYYNNSHELANYPRHKGQVQDNVLSIPLELWNWGIATRSGAPRKPNENRFKFALMPQANASVTREGLSFEGRYYTCSKAIREHWFERANQGRFTVPISYDKREVDRIYVHDAGELGFDVATLTPRSGAYQGLTGWEAHELDREYARMSAQHRDRKVLDRASAMADVQYVNDEARGEFEAHPAEGSLRSQTEGARQARAVEVTADRPEELSRCRPKMAHAVGEAAKIVPIRPELAWTDVSAPSMEELLAVMGQATDVDR